MGKILDIDAEVTCPLCERTQFLRDGFMGCLGDKDWYKCRYCGQVIEVPDSVWYIEIKPCDVCRKEFTPGEWEERHQPHEKGCPNSHGNYTEDECDCDLDVHARCCPECNN